MSQHQTADIVAQILGSLPELNAGPNRQNNALEGIFAQQLADTGLTNEKEKAPPKQSQGSSLSAPASDPTRDLGGTDDIFDLLSLLLGNSQEGFKAQGQQDFPGLNQFPNLASTQHLAAAGAGADLAGQTATGIGGGLIEAFENLTQGTNTVGRPQSVRDTTLDFLANQLGAGGGEPGAAVSSLNTLDNFLAGASPEQQFAVQDEIAPLAGPLSRALVNPGTITTSPIEGLLKATGGDKGIESLMQVLSQLFGVQGSRAGVAPKGTQTATGIRG